MSGSIKPRWSEGRYSELTPYKEAEARKEGVVANAFELGWKVGENGIVQPIHDSLDYVGAVLVAGPRGISKVAAPAVNGIVNGVSAGINGITTGVGAIAGFGAGVGHALISGFVANPAFEAAEVGKDYLLNPVLNASPFHDRGLQDYHKEIGYHSVPAVRAHSPLKVSQCNSLEGSWGLYNTGGTYLRRVELSPRLSSLQTRSVSSIQAQSPRMGNSNSLSDMFNRDGSNSISKEEWEAFSRAGRNVPPTQHYIMTQ